MRIGVDVDEVLGEFLRSMLPWLERTQGLSFGWHDMHTYQFYKAWHIPEGEAREYIDEFLESREFKRLSAVPGGKDAVRRLARHHELFVVTSRPRYVASITEHWLADEFGDVFEAVLYTNAHGVGDVTSKADIVRERGLDIHIDDNDAYTTHVVEQAERPALLFNKPWNTGASVPRKVRRFDTWDEALSLIEYCSTLE